MQIFSVPFYICLFTNSILTFNGKYLEACLKYGHSIKCIMLFLPLLSVSKEDS